MGKKSDQTKKMLLKLLNKGPRAKEEIESQLVALGVSKDTIRNVRREMGLTILQEIGNDGRRDFWMLPYQEVPGGFKTKEKQPAAGKLRANVGIDELIMWITYLIGEDGCSHVELEDKAARFGIGYELVAKGVKAAYARGDVREFRVGTIKIGDRTITKWKYFLKPLPELP